MVGDQNTFDLQKRIEQLELQLSDRQKENHLFKQRYEILESTLTDIVWTTDEQLRFNYISPSIHEALGYSVTEIINQKIEKILPPLSYAKILEESDGLFGNPVGDNSVIRENYELQLLKKDNTKMWADVMVAPLLDVNNNLIGIKGVLKNITEQKHSNEALDISTNTLQRVFENLDALVYIADMDTYEVLYINKYTKNLFGDIIGKVCWQSLQTGLDSPCNHCTNRRLIDSDGNPTRVYVREARNSVNNRWYETHNQAVRWKDGRVVRFQIGYDITSRKRDEMKLFKYLKQEELISKISYTFNTTNDFDSKMNKILEMLGHNNEVSRVFVFENNKQNKSTSNVYEWCNNSTSPKRKWFQHISFNAWEEIDSLLSQNKPVRIKDVSKELSPAIAAEFEKHKIQSMILMPINLKNIFFGFFGFDQCEEMHKWQMAEVELLRTISNIFSNAYQRKIIEEAIRENEQKLKEANATKDKMFSIIGHDLRGPMGNLKSMLELLADDPDLFNDEMLDMLKDSAGSTFYLLENLLFWAKSQRGEMKFTPSSVSLNQVFLENLILLKANAENKKIAFASHITGNMTASGDYNMITTVVRNLISNALKFTPAGGCITVKAEQLDSEFHTISVQDTGVGISEENIPKIFNKNQHYTTYGTNQEKGSGLGLMLCKEFVEKNGGEILVESEVNKGSTFKFTVPVAKNLDGKS